MKYFSGLFISPYFWNIYQRVHMHSLQTLIYSIYTLCTSQIFPYYSSQWKNLELFEESSHMESCIQIYYLKSCIQFYYNNIRTIWLNSLFIFLGHFLSYGAYHLFIYKARGIKINSLPTMGCLCHPPKQQFFDL